MNVQGKTKQIYWTFVAEIQLVLFRFEQLDPCPPHLIRGGARVSGPGQGG